MASYSMTCMCGHTTTVDAASRDEAVTKIQNMMTDDALQQHMAEKHPGEPAPSKQHSDAMIAQNVKEA